jgi:hypothetical protein
MLLPTFFFLLIVPATFSWALWMSLSGFKLLYRLAMRELSTEPVPNGLVGVNQKHRITRMSCSAGTLRPELRRNDADDADEEHLTIRSDMYQRQ